jgi:hypothetical protein
MPDERSAVWDFDGEQVVIKPVCPSSSGWGLLEALVIEYERRAQLARPSATHGRESAGEAGR